MSDDARTAQEDYLSDEEIIAAVAALRFPADAAARRQFCASHARVIHRASPRPSDSVTVVITPEEDERLDMLLYAKHLVEFAEAGLAKAPPPEPINVIDPVTGNTIHSRPVTVEEQRAGVAAEIEEVRRLPFPYGQRRDLFPILPEFDEDLDDKDSFQWHVSYVHAAELLNRGKRALEMLAIGEWDHARVILLRAHVLELEIEKRWLQIRERDARDKFKPGRKDGAVGELGRLIMDVLRGDPRMSATDVKAALSARITYKGERFFLQPGHRGTKWSSIESRLPWYRALVRREQQEQQPPVK